jgi:hypothetical protein
LIVGYFVGKFGLFGIPKEVPPTPGKQAMNIVTCLKLLTIDWNMSWVAGIVSLFLHQTKR